MKSEYYFYPLSALMLAALVFSVSARAQTTAMSDLHTSTIPRQQCSCNCGQLQALQNAPITQHNLIKWADGAISSIFSYGFGNYNTALSNSSHYFTPQGWLEFKRAFDKSGNLQAVKSNKLMVSSKNIETPRVIKNALNNNGQETWQIQVPVEVTYQNALHTVKQKLVVTLQIAKQPHAKTMQGVGIVQFIAEPKNNSA